MASEALFAFLFNFEIHPGFTYNLLMFFLPFILLIFIFYLILVGLLFFFLQVGLISFAFERLGIPEDILFSLLFLTLFGSLINIPLKRYVTEIETPGRVIDFFGWKFKIPGTRYAQQTTIAVNVGGAVVPTLISIYLILKWPVFLPEIIMATLLMSLFVHKIARPIRGVGIATPALLPPLMAAALGLMFELILQPGAASIIAYSSGTLGTLIGADLMNLKKITTLGAPVASIGGAGTFDGIFLTGLIAVILTSF